MDSLRGAWPGHQYSGAGNASHVNPWLETLVVPKGLTTRHVAIQTRTVCCCQPGRMVKEKHKRRAAAKARAFETITAASATTKDTATSKKSANPTNPSRGAIAATTSRTISTARKILRGERRERRQVVAKLTT